MRQTQAAIHLLPLTNHVEVEEVLSVCPAGEIFACDFYLTGAESWEEKAWGFQRGRVTNLDHHAPVGRMTQHISSTNLALLRVRHDGVAPSGSHIVLNHTDCDSVLSAAVLSGDVDPDDVFGVAALAADHTGELNPIADLLQAVDALRDYDLSLRNLHLLLENKPLEPAVQEALDVRYQKRKTAAEVVAQGVFKRQGKVFFAELDAAIDGEFFPVLLPDAIIILMFSPRTDDNASGQNMDASSPPLWNVKLRLGASAPAGLSLHDLKLSDWDQNFGGRWNAGSNKRGGGTDLNPFDYALQVAHCLETELSQRL